jgi:hypothetical protein
MPPMPQPDDDRFDLDATSVADTEPPPASGARPKTTLRRPTLLGGFQPPPVAPANEATLRAAGLSRRPIRAPR